MPGKKFFDVSTHAMLGPGDGWKHLAVSVVQYALRDADNGDETAIDWLVGDGLVWAEFAGGNRDAVREAMCKRYNR